MVGNNQLRFRDLISEELVFIDLAAVDRNEVLRTMAQNLVDRGFCKPSFVDGILDREEHHPSALPMPGHKIAIPHTDAEHVEKSAILFARLASPVEFKSMGDPNETLQVGMISMFALKEKKRIGDLLETLITVYQDESVLNRIHSAGNAREIYVILRSEVELQEIG